MLVAESAIGRLLTQAELSQWPDGPLRSAFVISGTHVLSAWHCVQAVGGRSVRAWLVLEPPDDGTAPGWYGNDRYIAVPRAT